MPSPTSFYLRWAPVTGRARALLMARAYAYRTNQLPVIFKAKP